MKNKTFYTVLFSVVFVGALSVIVMCIYTYILWQDCSILSYIANRG